jgi:hypothetical protein
MEALDHQRHIMNRSGFSPHTRHLLPGHVRRQAPTKAIHHDLPSFETFDAKHAGLRTSCDNACVESATDREECFTKNLKPLSFSKSHSQGSVQGVKLSGGAARVARRFRFAAWRKRCLSAVCGRIHSQRYLFRDLKDSFSVEEFSTIVLPTSRFCAFSECVPSRALQQLDQVSDERLHRLVPIMSVDPERRESVWRSY